MPLKALRLQKIVKSFSHPSDTARPVLKELNLEVRQGDFITLIGGNGAGKSTLLNIIAGTLSPDTGTIHIYDREVTRFKEEKRAAFIGRVFQDPLMGTAPRMTVSENLAIALRRGQKRKIRKGTSASEQQLFKEQLASLGLGLEKRLNVEIGTLSGGQRQAIALLMATLKKPDLLLLDEHTAALDPKTSLRMMELTEERVQKENLTALMITHNLSDALRYGNRLIMLDQGKVVLDLQAEEKKQMTVLDLMKLFEEQTKEKDCP